MKFPKPAYAGLLALTLTACAGSDTYRGAWKATDMGGTRTTITFDAKTFAVTDSTGHTDNYTYTQNTVKISNGVRTYGLQLGDGRTLSIIFPTPDDQATGIITDALQAPLYVISRNGYKTYSDMSQLKQE